MTDITQAILKDNLHYDQDTGVFTWQRRVTGNWSAARNGRSAGCVKRTTGYVYIGINGKTYLAHRLAWLYVHGVFPPDHTDHVNGCRTDNRIENLRPATVSENMFNSGKPTSNSSGVKGVTWHKQRRKWMAQGKIRGKSIYIGLFNSFTDATDARRKFALSHHGDFYHE